MRVAIVGTANNRPDYLDETLESWARAIDHAQRFANMNLVAWQYFCEPMSDESVVQMKVVLTKWHELYPYFSWVQNKEILGPYENPFRAIESQMKWEWRKAFPHGDVKAICPDLIVLAEDDAVVSVDALTYLIQSAMHEIRPTIHCLNHKHQFPPISSVAKQTENIDRFSPVGWAVKPEVWEKYLRDSWDHDCSKLGWDWNINNKVIPTTLLNVRIPVLARSDHVGYHGGAHSTPETFEMDKAPTFDPNYSEINFKF